jgi:hypothetical protein
MAAFYIAINGLDESYLSQASDIEKHANAVLRPMFHSRSCNS